ncbi:MAG TPA: carboxypeptidase regulatory-like domain-containing protein [Candidatus Limnocylindrales bacterium]|nr:carboxypeptidase regulatory-like domain-containing protein [Candidatus Limnocylindrales bacterium]
MRFRSPHVLFPCFVLLFALAQTSFAQFGAMPSMSDRGPDTHFNHMGHEMSSLSGTVVSMAGEHPLGNVKVDLSEGATGKPVSTTYTDNAGSFSFSGVSSGNYLITATAGLVQVSDRIDISATAAPVTLRVPDKQSAADRAGADSNTVSVAQMRVPEKARAELAKAQELSSKGKLDDAQKHLAKSLEIFPDYADALTFRAVMRLSSDLPGAEADLQHAIKADGNYAMAYTVLGAALNAQGKFDQALNTLNRAISLAPMAWQNFFEMAKAYDATAKYQEGLQHIQKAFSLTAEIFPPMLLLRAHCLMGVHEFGNAVTDLEAFLKKDPSGANADTARHLLAQAQQMMAKK